jgi:hypothetical protein
MDRQPPQEASENPSLSPAIAVKQNPTRGPEDVRKQRKHKPKIAAPAEAA